MCAKEWSELLDIPYSVIKSRLSLKWDTDKILSTPYKKKIHQKYIIYKDKEYSLKELCQVLNISKSTLLLSLSIFSANKRKVRHLEQETNNYYLSYEVEDNLQV